MQKKKISILYLQTTLVCGGSVRAMLDQINLLDKEHFAPHVLVTREHGEWDPVFEQAGIPVTYLEDVVSPQSTLLGKLRNHIKAKKLLYAHQHDGKTLMKAVFGKDFDLVVVNQSMSFCGVGLHSSAKTVIYIHGDVDTNPTLVSMVKEADNAMQSADGIMCVSAEARGHYVQLTGRQDGVYLGYNPINAREVREKAELTPPVAVDAPYLCAIGRLSYEKGFLRLVKIYRRLLENGITHKLVLVGDGKEEAQIREEIRAHGMEDHVILTGYLENPYPYLKHSDLLVLPSYTEGLPVVGAEAFCLGIPIVSSHPSVGELFGKNREGGLITENDDESLYQGLYRVLTDSALYQTLRRGAENRRRYLESDALIRRIEDIYCGIVNGTPVKEVEPIE